MKPRARREDGVWLVWCESIGPTPRARFIDAYNAWSKRKAAQDKLKIGFIKIEVM